MNTPDFRRVKVLLRRNSILIPPRIFSWLETAKLVETMDITSGIFLAGDTIVAHRLWDDLFVLVRYADVSEGAACFYFRLSQTAQRSV